MWAWFCTWGGEFASYGTEYSEKYTEKSIIKKAYDSEYVLTLDELPEY
jgi:mannan endo-1,4-beta-mannosidase